MLGLLDNMARKIRIGKTKVLHFDMLVKVVQVGRMVLTLWHTVAGQQTKWAFVLSRVHKHIVSVRAASGALMITQR